MALLVSTGLGWGIARVVAPPDALPADARFVTVVAEVGEVEHSLDLVATAHWPRRAVTTNQAAGTVTTVDHDERGPVAAGDVLYTVDLRPVVAAVGTVPAFRDLRLGDVGQDVVQLQQLLRGLNFYSDSVDGRFGETTHAAVEMWQTALAIEADGVVRRGEVVFFPQLPSKLAFDDDLIAPGQALTGGEVAVYTLAREPVFRLVATSVQSQMTPDGTPIELTGPGDRLMRATVKGRTPAPNGTGYQLRLVAARGVGAPCRQACDRIPTANASSIPARVHVVPKTVGVVVPSAALRSSAEGDVEVTTATGEQVRVQLEAEANGQVVIRGIDPGTVVRVPRRLD